MKLETLLVAVDGSENSAVAIEWAAGLASLTGAAVVAVHARGLLESVGSGDDDPRTDTHERLEEWCAPLRRAGLRHAGVVRDGDPVSVILAVAEDQGADLVVMGSRGLGVYPEQLLGSTSTQVAQRSNRPITIVPADRSSAGDREEVADGHRR